jgi:hypothetical protein
MFCANYGTLLKASGGGKLQLAPPLRPSSRAALAGHSASLHSSKQAADSPSGALVLSPYSRTQLLPAAPLRMQALQALTICFAGLALGKLLSVGRAGAGAAKVAHEERSPRAVDAQLAAARCGWFGRAWSWAAGCCLLAACSIPTHVGHARPAYRRSRQLPACSCSGLQCFRCRRCC